MTSTLNVQIDNLGGVRVITLNRPEKLNALNGSLMAEFAEACGEAAQDPDVGCVVVTGAGRGFCAGGDVKEGSGGYVPANTATGSRAEQGSDRLRRFTQAVKWLHEMDKPTVAMVNGPLAGAGIGIAGACDLRFAAKSATFVSAYDRIGASGDFGATWFWTKILGTGVARELFFLGDKLSAQEALQKGIFTRVFADDALREQTLAVASRLASGPRVGYRYLKCNLNNAEDWSFEAAIDQEALHMTLSTAAAVAIYGAGRQ